MSKKILVIEEEKFKQELDYWLLSDPRENIVLEKDVLKALEKSKLKDVIEFEGTIEDEEVALGEELTVDRRIRIAETPDFEDDEDVQVFLVKKEKQ